MHLPLRFDDLTVGVDIFYFAVPKSSRYQSLRVQASKKMVQSDDIQERDRPSSLSPELIIQEIVEDALDATPDIKESAETIEKCKIW